MPFTFCCLSVSSVSQVLWMWDQFFHFIKYCTSPGCLLGSKLALGSPSASTAYTVVTPPVAVTEQDNTLTFNISKLFCQAECVFTFRSTSRETDWTCSHAHWKLCGFIHVTQTEQPNSYQIQNVLHFLFSPPFRPILISITLSSVSNSSSSGGGTSSPHTSTRSSESVFSSSSSL